MGIDRRTTLKMAGVSIATGAAGCLGSGGESGNGNGDGSDTDYPSYHRWLTTDDSGAAGYIYVGWSAFEETETGTENESTGGDSGALTTTDPMLGLPMSGAVAVALVVGFGLGSYGLDGLISSGGSDTDSTESQHSSIEAVLSTNEAIVLLGDIDTAAVTETLTAEPEGFSISKQYEQTDEIGDYGVYTPVEDAGSDAIAVGESALVFPANGDVDDPVGTIRTPIDAAAGDATRATDEITEFGWLVSTAGRGDFVFGGYGDEFEPESDSGDGGSDGGNESQAEFGTEYPELEGVDGGVGSLTLDENDTGATGKFAAIVGDGDASALEESLGSSAAESSVEIEDGRVTASATWRSLE
ncbi:hypothetical protein [Natrinema sp. 74]|uniref:hypothetical protein n=1 Tax=Natrinema sp. 74 TaxID=3384159 RepID=UPI0038D3EC8C